MRLSTILAQFDDHPEDKLPLGTVLDATRHAGFGFLIAFLALCALPLPGLGGPMGIAIAFLGVQLAVGREHPWLPQILRRRAISQRARRWLGERLARATSRLERLIKPRWAFLFRREMWWLVGLGLLLQGLGLALPIPLPGSNLIFIVPIVLYAIGLLEDDGVLVAIAHVAGTINVVLTVLLWDAVAHALRAVLSHLA
jgi:hypothetical protein